MLDSATGSGSWAASALQSPVMADWVGTAPLLLGPRRNNRIHAGAGAPVNPAASGGRGGGGIRRGGAGYASTVNGAKGADGSERNGERADGNLASEEGGGGGDDDDEFRNRQKELQDIVVAAETAEEILATTRELDGAIVISTALHRLGKTGISAATTRDPRFKALLEKFRLRLPFFGARQISNSLHGMGTIMYREGGPWVDMVVVQTQRRIRDFEPQHVSNTLWACARMQRKEPLMLRALLHRAIEDVGRYCPLDVSIVTWACATLKYREVEWFRAVVRSRLNFADFSPQNMSNFVWGLATLGFRNDNMVLALGREAARKLHDFIPQEMSNFVWALATMDLCDNLMLRAVAEEVERRGPEELCTWDPQSLSNMMWAYATLAVKDDPLFQLLLDASVARIEDHDPQNLANSSWAAAMVCFRSSRWLDSVAKSSVVLMSECQTLHLAQLAFAFSRLMYGGDHHQFFPTLLQATLQRVDEFAAQSLFDVHDALVFFRAIVASSGQCSIERRLNSQFDDLAVHLERFASACARNRPAAADVAAYRQILERMDIVTMGAHYTERFLQHFGILCPANDPFVADGRRLIQKWRVDESARDPTSRTIFHRAQCAWQLGMRCGNSAASDALADGVFESGEPTDGGPEQYGLVVCRLRHPREGDAEIQALCAALRTSVMRGRAAPPGVALNLHLSDVPCLSCLGATLQFHFRYPGMLRVSFDRGRLISEDSVPIPRPPPPPSSKPYPYVSMPKNGPPREEDGVDRSMLRREAPDCRETTSFYRGGLAHQRPDGAASGGQEAVPHKLISSLRGTSSQTFYFSAKPEFYDSTEYDECA